MRSLVVSLSVRPLIQQTRKNTSLTFTEFTSVNKSDEFSVENFQALTTKRRSVWLRGFGASALSQLGSGNRRPQTKKNRLNLKK